MTPSLVLLAQREALFAWVTDQPERDAAIVSRMGGVSLADSVLVRCASMEAAKALHALLKLAMPPAGAYHAPGVWPALDRYPLNQSLRLRQLLEHVQDLHPGQMVAAGEFAEAVDAQRRALCWKPRPIAPERLAQIRERQASATLDTQARARQSVKDLQALRDCCDVAVVLRRDLGYMLLCRAEDAEDDSLEIFLDSLQAEGFVDRYQTWWLLDQKIVAALLHGQPGLAPDEASTYWDWYVRLVWATEGVGLPGLDQEIPLPLYKQAQELLAPNPRVFNHDPFKETP